MAKEIRRREYEEKELSPINGWGALFLFAAAYIGAILLTVSSGIKVDMGAGGVYGFLLGAGIVWLSIGWFPFLGLKVVRPNEALVLTLFGKYVGTIKKEGFFFVNPFTIAVVPHGVSGAGAAVLTAAGINGAAATRSKISLKTLTHNNGKQKINDQLGNPIDVGIVVIWRVVNTAKAVFNVDNYMEFLSIQADSTLRDVVRCYPYDCTESDEKSLRGSSQEVSCQLREELQSRVESAGLEILEARITHLAYSPEIAAAMLQRQQATAIIEARQKIVDGAVGMVEMALNKLSESQIVELDDERKAQMVSNLLVVLCGNKDAQPIVNSGTIY